MKEEYLKQILAVYPTEKDCLDKLFELKTKNMECCPKCQKYDSVYSVLSKRQAYQCNSCLHQIYPKAGTIFENSTTPLYIWLYVFLLFLKDGKTSATEIKRQIGVTYKCAWKITKLVETTINGNKEFLLGLFPNEKFGLMI